MKKLLKICLSLILTLSVCFCAFFSINCSSVAAPPQVSLVFSREAVPVGETFGVSGIVYSEAGFTNNFRLSETCVSVSGTGKATVSDFTMKDTEGLTRTFSFKLTATYPGEIKVYIEIGSAIDRNGNSNSSPSVPKGIDIKIFNTEGEKAYQKMSEAEYFFTVLIAPFWSFLHSLGLV